MARDSESPYPANAVFGVHVGFKTGAFEEYRLFLAQTEGFPGGREVWAVFTDIRHATEYARTGICPVPPIAEKKARGSAPGPSSARSLPTPDTSPETENSPPALPTRQRPTISTPIVASVSQPPAAPRKPPVQPDSDGDTEPEEEYKPVSSSLPAQPTKKTPQNPPLRRPYKSGSITQALKRDASLTGGVLLGTQSPSPTKIGGPAPEPAPPSTAPAASSSTIKRRSLPDPPRASGSGLRTAPPAPPSAPIPTSIPALASVPAPAPALVPELSILPRPHGTYEQCHHCDGKGWILTPCQPPNPMPPPPPAALQTPSRPRAIPTTNLRLVSASDSDGASGSAVSRSRTPSGSRLRLSPLGGVGPDRTPKRDPKRVVSDSVAGRRPRIVSDSAKDKGKGKGKAVEPMDIDPSDSGAGPSTYNYL